MQNIIALTLMMCTQCLHMTLSAALQKSYGRPHSFQILSAFLHDFYVSHWPADVMWWQAKAIDFIHLYFTYDHRSKVS